MCCNLGIPPTGVVATWLVTPPEYKFAGVNPNLISGTGFLINGQMLPQRDLDLSNKPESRLFYGVTKIIWSFSL